MCTFRDLLIYSLEEKTLDDGSVVLKLIKQYNQSPVGDYLD